MSSTVSEDEEIHSVVQTMFKRGKVRSKKPSFLELTLNKQLEDTITNFDFKSVVRSQSPPHDRKFHLRESEAKFLKKMQQKKKVIDN